MSIHEFAHRALWLLTKSMALKWGSQPQKCTILFFDTSTLVSIFFKIRTLTLNTGTYQGVSIVLTRRWYSLRTNILCFCRPVPYCNILVTLQSSFSSSVYLHGKSWYISSDWNIFLYGELHFSMKILQDFLIVCGLSSIRNDRFSRKKAPSFK